MSYYKVTAGQNLYDVALHIYGSVEGVTDLLMNNPSLSFNDKLNAGDTLLYSDGLVINPEVTAYYKNQRIVPSGGERGVYPKYFTMPRIADIYLDSDKTTAGFSISGTGGIEIDWADNTPPERILLGDNVRKLYHTFDNAVSGRRKIGIYGDMTIGTIDLTDLRAGDVYFLEPVTAQKFTHANCTVNIAYAAMLRGVYEMNLKDISAGSLLPLLKIRSLMALDISGQYLKSHVVDEYLIGLVRHYYGRRSCTVTMTCTPSGEYREPARDGNLNYILTTGMEAVWVITNEPAWNEGGFWKFIIDDKTYTGER